MITQHRIPQIEYEAVVFGTNLVMNPSGIIYVPTGQDFTLDKFTLPSTNQSGGAVVYQAFEEMLSHSIAHTIRNDSKYRAMPESDARIQLARAYTKGHLEQVAGLMEKLDANVVSDFKARVMADYEGHRLPVRAYGAEQDLNDEEKILVAGQFVEHIIRKRASQPVRRVYALFTVDAGKHRDATRAIIEGFVKKYEEMSHANLHPLAIAKANEFAVGLDAMVNDKTDVKL